MLLTNIYPCDFFSQCLYKVSGGGNGYLESDFSGKIPCRIQSVCTHGHGGGGLAECEKV